MTLNNLNQKASRLSEVLLIFALLVFCVFGILKTTISIPTGQLIRPADYYPAPKQIAHFALGYEHPFADILWIRVLQDLDYCEKTISEKQCVSKGWLFKVLDLATDLDSNFYMPHAYGALGLSVLVTDIEGGSLIFEKGMRHFPKDWQIHYWAGYHALTEEHNEAKAAEYYAVAARNGAPQWTFLLAKRLATSAGRQELADNMVKELEKSKMDQELIAKIKDKLQKNVGFSVNSSKSSSMGKSEPGVKLTK